MERRRIDIVALEDLRPANPTMDDAGLLRHMDQCVAVAVRLGACEGAALAAQASVMDRHPDDLAEADRALVVALLAILGFDDPEAPVPSTSADEGTTSEPAAQLSSQPG